MKSRWNETEANACADDHLKLRVYSSRIIGQDPDLVLHGGGNTSVKSTVTNLFGDVEDVLFVKGSGWDLATIEAPGFTPVKLDTLKRLATLETLSDTEMVKQQRAATLEPSAPNPSVEAILHAIIPFRYVDHTHADAVVTLTNTPGGEERIRALYGDRVLVIPYVMPGFILARKIAEITRDVDWSKYEGMVLMSHGIFSFDDDARISYERMIKLVDEAEQYLKTNNAWETASTSSSGDTFNALQLAELRQQVSKIAAKPMLAKLTDSPAAQGFSQLKNVASIATRGPLTPDHVIRTKQKPLIVSPDTSTAVQHYIDDYGQYFNKQDSENLTCLDPAPRWAVWPGVGTVAFDTSAKATGIINDIVEHSVRCIQWAEQLGGWVALPDKDIFDVEYWELEQAKLNKNTSAPVFQGQVALVSGAASGIGQACVEQLQSQGAAVVALDINPDITTLFSSQNALGLVCDMRNSDDIKRCIELAVKTYGGIDIMVSNAGMFPHSQTIADMEDATWDASITINLTSHQRLLKACIPYLKLGVKPAVVIIGSKNVPAPGPGASAYSAAKAGLNQLARIAAMELANDGVRVNITHPDAVFDTAIWTDEILQARAKHYGMTVQEYKTKNLLHTEITSKDVANLVCCLAGPVFSKTTGAQIPVDGGNDRVI
ncbi:MAG: bifunctional aldolase/short-chain dehydrogenase [Gammaproteobacteria bacterium]